MAYRPAGQCCSRGHTVSASHQLGCVLVPKTKDLTFHLRLWWWLHLKEGCAWTEAQCHTLEKS